MTDENTTAVSEDGNRDTRILPAQAETVRLDAPDTASDLAGDDDMITVRPTLFYAMLGIFVFIVGLSLGYIIGERMTLSTIQTVSSAAAEIAVSNAEDEIASSLESVLLGLAGADAGSAPAQAAAEPAGGAVPAGDVQRFPIDADDDPFVGPADAPIEIIEFSDYQCPFCARFRAQTLDVILDTYPEQVKFVYRDFPLDNIHPQARDAAVAANCAGEQDLYWEMHDLLYANQNALGQGMLAFGAQLDLDMDDYEACLDSGRYDDEIQNDFLAAAQLGVTGTPTFFINGRPLVGAQPFAAFQQIIEDELSRMSE